MYNFIMYKVQFMYYFDRCADGRWIDINQDTTILTDSDVSQVLTIQPTAYFWRLVWEYKKGWLVTNNFLWSAHSSDTQKGGFSHQGVHLYILYLRGYIGLHINL